MTDAERYAYDDGYQYGLKDGALQRRKQERYQLFVLPLPDGRGVVSLNGPADMTADEWAFVVNVLDIALRPLASPDTKENTDD